MNVEFNSCEFTVHVSIFTGPDGPRPELSLEAVVLFTHLANALTVAKRATPNIPPMMPVDSPPPADELTPEAAAAILEETIGYLESLPTLFSGLLTRLNACSDHLPSDDRAALEKTIADLRGNQSRLTGLAKRLSTAVAAADAADNALTATDPPPVVPPVDPQPPAGNAIGGSGETGSSTGVGGNAGAVAGTGGSVEAPGNPPAADATTPPAPSDASGSSPSTPAPQSGSEGNAADAGDSSPANGETPSGNG